MIFIAFAMQGKAFYILSERETKNGGYIDVAFYRRPGNSKVHHQYIFEIKYLKKKRRKPL